MRGNELYKKFSSMSNEEKNQLLGMLVDALGASEHPTPVRKQKYVPKNNPETRWLVDGKLVYTNPDAYISKKMRYAVRMQAEKAGAVKVTGDDRNKLVEKLKDQYVQAYAFKSNKAAKAFADAENNWSPEK